MDTSRLVKTGELGSGVYGKVYEAVTYPDFKTVAIKRNYANKNVMGISNLRELDILSRVGQHSCILQMLDVKFESIFDGSMSPVQTLRHSSMKDDNVHFVVEKCQYSGAEFLCNRVLCHPSRAIISILQLLLGLEWLHSSGIAHRDLKPENLLIKRDKNNGDISVVICDFGMSQYLNASRPASSGVTSPWYRSPEVCLEKSNYDCKIDMWAVGCILFEIYAGEPYLKNRPSKNKDVHNSICKNAEVDPFGRFDVKFAEQHQHTHGPIQHVMDLIGKLLVYNPEDRLCATDAINHPLFYNHKAMIASIRTRYPPVPRTCCPPTIVRSFGREWMGVIAMELYKDRRELEWYSDGVIFHAIDTFDRIGDLNLSKKETELYFYVCLYIWHKFFTATLVPLPWHEFVPDHLQDSSVMFQAQAIEINIVKNILKYNLYYETPLEHFGKKSVQRLLTEYLKIKEWEGKGWEYLRI